MSADDQIFATSAAPYIIKINGKQKKVRQNTTNCQHGVSMILLESIFIWAMFYQCVNGSFCSRVEVRRFLLFACFQSGCQSIQFRMSINSILQVRDGCCRYFNFVYFLQNPK